MSTEPITLRVDAIEPRAFDALYSPEHGVNGEYPYGVITFTDRRGNRYWWATSSDTKSLDLLKAGQFITTEYRERDFLPGDEHHWSTGGEPDGLSIYDLRWRFAKWSDRWGVSRPQRKPRVSGNIARALQNIKNNHRGSNE